MADDERHILRFIQVNLERQGHVVTTVEDGAAAIAELERDASYTHAVLDLMMSRVDGLQVLKWIRDHEQTRSMFVVVLSAQAEALSQVPMERSADLWITKPFRDSNWF